MQPVLIINGPNLNMLGTREPGVYGYETIADISVLCEGEAEALSLSVDFRQSNHEGEIITWIQEAKAEHSGIIINAGAYSHTSIGIMDALRTVGKPIVEVHISNIYARESYRHHSYISAVANGVICGLGGKGYVLALQAMANLLE